MADSGDDSDLISQVQVVGADTATKALEDYGDKGADAFNKVADAAAKSSKTVQKATGDQQKATDAAAKSADDLGKSTSSISGAASAAQLGQVSAAAEKFGASVRKGVEDVAKFVERVVALGAAGAAASIGILALAKSVAAGQQSQSTAFADNAAQQIKLNNSQLQGTTAAINYESAQRKLLTSFNNGTIDSATYDTNLQSLRQEYQEQIRVSAQVANAQDEVTDANARLQKQVADRTAYTALVDTYGGPLLGSLTALGNQVIAIGNDFKTAFGPVVASLLDIITASVTKNSAVFSQFFDSAASKIQTFVNANGPAIQKALDTIAAAAASVFDGLIAALPGLLSLFNNVLVPAVKAGISVFSGVASALSKVFGPGITTGVVVAAAAILKLTGGFKVLFDAIRVGNALVGLLFSPAAGWVIAIGLVIAALVLLSQVDWSGLLASAQEVIGKVLAYFQALPGQVSGFFVDLWKSVTDLASAAGQAVIDDFNAVVTFFQNLPSTIGTIFSDLGNSIVQYFTTAFNTVLNTLKGWANSVLQYVQPVLDVLKAIAALGGGATGSTDAGGAQQFAGGGLLQGPGTATSDSIPIWGSTGEFMVKARAVAKYGVNFMRAINSGRFDPGRALRLAGGGLVSSIGSTVNNINNSVPRVAFAGGGPSTNIPTKMFSLVLDNQSFDGLLAPENVAERLMGLAIKKQASSGGRKPSWVGNGNGG